ncbi:hypothetical protein ACN4EE_18985 [Geminocystis sp. CENA526]|uniref:hypothetical protein n=1 Tax=Geminocystis sp. CENA526 TaxID=1355871 RepID=UPI003D6DEC80
MAQLARDYDEMKIGYFFIRYLLLNLAIFNGLFLWLNIDKKVLAQDKLNNNKCGGNLQELADFLVKDIADYANRVIQRSRIYSHGLEFLPTYVITASKPDLEPLPLEQTQYKSSLKNIDENQVKQIFFTTLERQYSSQNRIIETQNFHWLMLTPTEKGWRMIMLLTRLGYPNDNGSQNFISSPPRDSSDGIIAQSVKLWLRDCQYR